MNTKSLLYKMKNKTTREIKEVFAISNGTISKYLKSSKKPKDIVDNAIIYAAGVGSRLKPLTNEIPKPLLKINGIPMIETTIKNLIKNNIKDITIVVGHLADKFDYLKRKYNGVKILLNSEYKEFNNIHSLFIAKEILNNTLIIEGDIFWELDAFSKYYDGNSIYTYKSLDINSEWSFLKNSHGKIIDTKKGARKSDFCWVGCYFITKETSSKVRTFFNNKYNVKVDGSIFAEQLLWKLGIAFNGIEINKNIFTEIDTIDEYNEKVGIVNDVAFNDPMDIISYYFSVDKSKIINFSPIKGGLTNNSYSFVVNNKKYVLRSPKKETNINIDRYLEYDIIEKIKDLNISAKKVIFSPETGIAIFEFYEHESVFESHKNNIESFAVNIRKIHSRSALGIKKFNANKLISQYLENTKIPDEIIKISNKVSSLFEKHSIQKSLCHNDLLAGNILCNNTSSIIIDWEFAGVNDPYWDIASWVTENNITNDDLKIFEKKYGDIDRKKLNYFKYIVLGFWIVWCYQQKNWSPELKNYHDDKIKALRELNV